MRFFTIILLSVIIMSCQENTQDQVEVDSTEVFIPLEKNSYHDKVSSHRESVNLKFKDMDHSPLEKDSIKNFIALNYFPIDEKWNIKAKYTLIDTGVVFNLATTTDRVIPMKKHGVITFIYNQELVKLYAYTYVDHPDEDLFVPFLDATNGDETYGGGRYLEVKYPQNDSVWIDFNTAYNPYCAYNHHYSCPIPPLENTLNLSINAGEKVLYIY